MQYAAISFIILDLGCGVGRNAIPLAEYFSNCKIDCVDILPSTIKKLNEKAVHYGVSELINGVVSSTTKKRIKKLKKTQKRA